MCTTACGRGEFGADRYRAEFLEKLGFLRVMGFIVCGVVTDLLEAQRVGLREALNSSEPWFASIRHIECLCHVTSLVFTRAMATCQTLSDIVDQVLLRAKLLRNARSGSEMPFDSCHQMAIYNGCDGVHD